MTNSEAVSLLMNSQYYSRGYNQGVSDVLDKISAEIIELRSKQNVGVLECLDIIDKYKSESEVV